MRAALSPLSRGFLHVVSHSHFTQLTQHSNTLTPPRKPAPLPSACAFSKRQHYPSSCPNLPILLVQPILHPELLKSIFVLSLANARSHSRPPLSFPDLHCSYLTGPASPPAIFANVIILLQTAWIYNSLFYIHKWKIILSLHIGW